MTRPSLQTQRSIELDDRAAALSDALRGIPTQDIVRRVIEQKLAGDLAVVSSFGAESAVLLHLVAQVDPTVPVIFLDTRRHFPETLAYRDLLADLLGLQDLRITGPTAAAVKSDDPDGTLFSTNPDLCCHIRKTLPMGFALRDIDCSITGRKRFQAATRAELTLFETQNGRLKFNPLFDWDAVRLRDYMAEHALPPHPLVAQGYPSIGCAACTAQVSAGADPRSGRWAGQDKTECGIHFENGKMVRKGAAQK